MIDWPNAIVRFVLGIGATLPFWIHDRVHARRERRADLWEAWKVAMKEIELHMWNPETRASDLYVARTRFSIDHWRAILDDRTGFVLLEELERAYSTVEHFDERFRQLPNAGNQKAFLAATDRWKSARIAFANYSRSAQSNGYNDVVSGEERQERRKKLIRHPFTALKRHRSMR